MMMPVYSYLTVTIIASMSSKKQNKKIKKLFQFIHLNIHSIQPHIQELRNMLLPLEFKFDFVAISDS